MRIGSFLLFGTFCQVAVAGGGFGAMAWVAQLPTSFSYTRAISQDEADKGSIKVCQSQMEIYLIFPRNPLLAKCLSVFILDARS